MAVVPISAGYSVLLDDEDLALVTGHRWTAQRTKTTVYAYRQPKVDGRRTKVYMHRLILGLLPGRQPEVDHRNGDGLDNRKANLRAATSTQNSGNQRTRVQAKPKSSRFKGVFWNTQHARWAAGIQVNGRHRHLGFFVIEEDAANAYDVAARSLFGEYANTNT